MKEHVPLNPMETMCCGVKCLILVGIQVVWIYVQLGLTRCILISQVTGPGHAGMPSHTQYHVSLSSPYM